MSFLEQYLNKKQEVQNVGKELEKLEQSVGTFQLEKIYHTCMYYQFKPSNVSSDLTKLDEITVNGTKYKIIIDFLSKYGPGDYFGVDKLIETLPFSEQEEHYKNMEILESLLLHNSIMMYKSLNPTRRIAHKELTCLYKSKKKMYTYQYPGDEYKQYRLGFIGVEEESGPIPV